MHVLDFMRGSIGIMEDDTTAVLGIWRNMLYGIVKWAPRHISWTTQRRVYVITATLRIVHTIVYAAVAVRYV